MKAVIFIGFISLYCLIFHGSIVKPVGKINDSATLNEALERQIEDWNNNSKLINLARIVDSVPITTDLLLEKRIILIGRDIDDTLAQQVQRLLIELEKRDSTKEIQIFINSPGGSVIAGLGIYDAIQYVRCDVSTSCHGLCASMAAVLLAGGTKGKRFATKTSRIMIHAASGNQKMNNADMDILQKLVDKSGEELYAILSVHTGQSIEKIVKDCEVDYWMTAQEAKEYGIIDFIIDRK